MIKIDVSAFPMYKCSVIIILRGKPLERSYFRFEVTKPDQFLFLELNMINAVFYFFDSISYAFLIILKLCYHHHFWTNTLKKRIKTFFIRYSFGLSSTAVFLLQGCMALYNLCMLVCF